MRRGLQMFSFFGGRRWLPDPAGPAGGAKLGATLLPELAHAKQRGAQKKGSV